MRYINNQINPFYFFTKKWLTIFIIGFYYFTVIPNFLQALDLTNDDLLVERIASVLLKEYDNYKDKSLIERIILKLGRSAYFDSIAIWVENYKDIEQIKIKLHPQLEYMAKTAEKNLPEEEGDYFRQMLNELTLLAFKSVQMYYTSMKDYLAEHPVSYEEITTSVMEDALCRMKYYNEKKVLYDHEAFVKSEISRMLNEKNLKYRLSLHAYAFHYFDKIRKAVIVKELEKMLGKIQAEEASKTYLKE